MRERQRELDLKTVRGDGKIIEGVWGMGIGRRDRNLRGQ